MSSLEKLKEVKNHIYGIQSLNQTDIDWAVEHITTLQEEVAELKRQLAQNGTRRSSSYSVNLDDKSLSKTRTENDSK